MRLRGLGVVVLLFFASACKRQQGLSEQEWRSSASQAAQQAWANLPGVFEKSCSGSNGFFASQECIEALGDAAASQKKVEKKLAELLVGEDLRVKNDRVRGAALCMSAALTLIQKGTGRNTQAYLGGKELIPVCISEYTAAFAPASASPGPESASARIP